MITTNDIATVTDGNVFDNDGNKIGSVGQIYLDNESGNPEWVTVKTGLFGSSASFVPLADARIDGENIRVPYEKSKVKDAPNIEDDAELSPQEEDKLYSYYGVGNAGQSTSGGNVTGGDRDRDVAGTTGTVGTGNRDTDNRGTDSRDTDNRDRRTDVTDTEGHDTSGPNTDNAMTRSEEQLRVGTRSEETGKARLRKYVVTEQQTQTVPVSREEVTIDREPITDANVDSATSGRGLTEEEHEVTLHAERPVVDKETVPVERVKLGTETVRGEETVTETVGKEQIEVDGDGDISDRKR